VKRTFVAVVLAVVFVLALAAPALAQSITHTATYAMDGVINFKKQAGHLCNTGAEVKQTIAGSGTMDKVQTVKMERGLISMSDTNDWVAGATALTVTTVWELCAPPKYTYETVDGDAIVHPFAMYPRLTADPAAPDMVSEPLMVVGVGAGNVNMLQGRNVSDRADDARWDPVSEQIWAVQVQANPGFSGNLHQKGEAAYGPFEAGIIVDAEGAWTGRDFTWGWDGTDAEVGPDFVGNYFSMEQMARTSQGTLRRYIDISSPFSHGYVMEDMSVVGKSEIKEGFVMGNLPKGADIVGLWWDLF